MSTAYSYDFEVERNRNKADWAGVSLGDAFRPNMDYALRLLAQKRFYSTVRRVQRAVAEHAGIRPSATLPEVRPQLSPCYTTYPSVLAAHAAIGLTAYLEFKTQIEKRFRPRSIRGLLEIPQTAIDPGSDPETYETVAEMCARLVENRILLQDLSQIPAGSFIESYRLFCAAQQDMSFSSLQEIVRAVVLFGDLLPDRQAQSLHPMTCSILGGLVSASSPFLRRLSSQGTEKLLPLGFEWVKALLSALTPYLPRRDKSGRPVGRQRGKTAGAQEGYRLATVAPLNRPAPLVLEESSDPLAQTPVHLLHEGSNRANGESLMRAVAELAEVAQNATGQSASEDIRSETLERVLKTGFEEGPIAGNATDGHEVELSIGEHRETATVFDRTVELSDDFVALSELLAEARPITAELKRMLYPGIVHISENERFCPSGTLDPSRIAAALFSDAVYRRNRIKQRPDKRGRPLLLIACDGSASLERDQIHMVKLLAASWMDATLGAKINILAGLYNSGTIRGGLSGPLVQWIYHPKKTPAGSRADALRALASLPDKGEGTQSDALSIAFMLNEALSLAKKSGLYLIIITDTAWNSCFHAMSGAEEMRDFFKQAYENHGNRLHVTLVALGVEKKTDFEDLVDRVIHVKQAELAEPETVAEKIGTYVASCMKERRRICAGRR